VLFLIIFHYIILNLRIKLCNLIIWRDLEKVEKNVKRRKKGQREGFWWFLGVIGRYPQKGLKRPKKA